VGGLVFASFISVDGFRPPAHYCGAKSEGEGNQEGIDDGGGEEGEETSRSV